MRGARVRVTQAALPLQSSSSFDAGPGSAGRRFRLGDAWVCGGERVRFGDPSYELGRLNSGVDMFAVGKVPGHASYQSTQRYSHLANDTLLKAGAAKQAAA